MKSLSFDEKNHEYRLISDDGSVAIIPSVTQIASSVTGKDLSGIDPAILSAATERGNSVHLDVQHGTCLTDEGQWIEKQINRKDYVFEMMDYSDVDGTIVAGRCDILGDDELIDVKSGSTEDILYWTIQLNLYRQMYADINRLRVLHVPKSGNYRSIQIAVLPEEKIHEIMEAFRGGRILSESFLVIDKEEAPSLDLVIYSHNVGELTTNAKAILQSVKRQLSTYKAENYSETNIAEAKRDKAELNAASKKLNDKRLELEREFMKPFVEFKDTITETCNEIKKASSLIDSVVKDVELREKDEKRKLIEDFFSGLKCELFSLEAIFNPSWLNKTTKIKDVHTEIHSRIEKTNADLIVLDRIGEPEAKAFYLNTLNLETALAKADEIKNNRERLSKIEAERLAKATEPRPAPIAAPVIPESKEAPTEPLVAQETAPAPEIYERTFLVRCTRDQLIALGDFMNQNGIDFKKL